MKKRAVAAVLWFLAAWVASAMLAQLIGLPELAAPFIGLVAAIMIGGDPLHLIWTRPDERVVRWPIAAVATK